MTNSIGENQQRFNRFQAAKYLGVSVVTLDRAVKAKRLACFRVARRVVFDRTQLDAFLAKNEQAAKF